MKNFVNLRNLQLAALMCAMMFFASESYGQFQYSDEKPAVTFIKCADQKKTVNKSNQKKGVEVRKEDILIGKTGLGAVEDLGRIYYNIDGCVYPMQSDMIKITKRKVVVDTDDEWKRLYERSKKVLPQKYFKNSEANWFKRFFGANKIKPKFNEYYYGPYNLEKAENFADSTTIYTLWNDSDEIIFVSNETVLSASLGDEMLFVKLKDEQVPTLQFTLDDKGITGCANHPEDDLQTVIYKYNLQEVLIQNR